MGVFGKLAFWKKDDDIFGKDDFGADSFGANKGLENSAFGNQKSYESMGGLDQNGLPTSNTMGAQTDPLGTQNSFGDSNQNLGLGNMGKSGMPDIDKGIQATAPSGNQYSQPSGDSGYSSFGQTPVQEAPPGAAPHNMDVISAKLDAIRATLDSINQRIMNLERVAYEDENKAKPRNYGW